MRSSTKVSFSLLHPLTDVNILLLVIEDESEAGAQADLVLSRVIPLGHRFHSSDSAFPLSSFGSTF